MTQPDIRITGTTFDGSASQSGSTLGDLLRARRQETGVSLNDAGTALKIKPAYLAALEEGRHDALPTAAHGRGFLRSYAQYLGLGAQMDNLLALHQSETAGRAASPALSMPMPLPEGKLPTARVVTVALLAAVILYFFWHALQAAPTPATITPPPSDLEKPAAVVAPPPAAPAPAAEAPAAIAPVTAVTVPDAPPAEEPPQQPKPESKTETAPTAPADVKSALPKPVAGSQVVVRALSDSWIEIQDRSGATIFSRLLHAGQEYPVPADEAAGLRLTTGNGAGIVVVRDGKPSAPVGTRAEVVRNVSLAAQTKPAPRPKPATVATPAPAAPQPQAADSAPGGGAVDEAD